MKTQISHIFLCLLRFESYLTFINTWSVSVWLYYLIFCVFTFSFEHFKVNLFVFCHSFVAWRFWFFPSSTRPVVSHILPTSSQVFFLSCPLSCFLPSSGFGTATCNWNQYQKRQMWKLQQKHREGERRCLMNLFGLSGDALMHWCTENKDIEVSKWTLTLYIIVYKINI